MAGSSIIRLTEVRRPIGNGKEVLGIDCKIILHAGATITLIYKRLNF
ncbi:MAG: hypothetical protein WED05_10835 [Candidatus Atabeyarchaeum deiterrae]